MVAIFEQFLYLKSCFNIGRPQMLKRRQHLFYSFSDTKNPAKVGDFSDEAQETEIC